MRPTGRSLFPSLSTFAKKDQGSRNRNPGSTFQRRLNRSWSQAGPERRGRPLPQPKARSCLPSSLASSFLPQRGPLPFPTPSRNQVQERGKLALAQRQTRLSASRKSAMAAAILKPETERGGGGNPGRYHLRGGGDEVLGRRRPLRQVSSPGT